MANETVFKRYAGNPIVTANGKNEKEIAAVVRDPASRIASNPGR